MQRPKAVGLLGTKRSWSLRCMLQYNLLCYADYAGILSAVGDCGIKDSGPGPDHVWALVWHEANKVSAPDDGVCVGRP